MRITIGNFELDTRFGFFIHVPGLVEAHRYPGGQLKHPWTVSWRSEIRRVNKARKEKAGFFDGIEPY